MQTERPMSPQNNHAEAATERAILMAADAIGEIIGFWNFKPSMGRVWTVLYLSSRPLAADEIARLTGLSAGSVSMTVQDLIKWGVIRKAFVPSDRRRFYQAETEILSLVTRVFRERELRLVSDVVKQLETSLQLLDAEGRSSNTDQMLENRFVVTRVRNLVALARVGHAIIEKFSQGGLVDLRTLRGALTRRG